jgi:tetratricopeptide (TPR) repeat protein
MPPQDPFHLAQAKDALGRGNHWFQRGCPAEADRYFELGLEQARLADDVPLIVKSLNARGAALMSQDDLDGAALVLERALELSVSLDARPELDSVLGNLGLLALRAGRADDAREMWGQAAQEATAKGLGPILYHCNLARLEMAAGNAAWKEYAAQALAEAAEPGAPESAVADAYNLAAISALEDGDEGQAERFLDLALELDRKNENQRGLAQDLETLAGIQAKTGRPLLAAASLDRAFYLWAALRDRQAQARVLSSLESLSGSSGHPKSTQGYREVLRKPGLFNPIDRLCP